MCLELQIRAINVVDLSSYSISNRQIGHESKPYKSAYYVKIGCYIVLYSINTPKLYELETISFPC